jgi:hypothetical protein
MKNTDEVIKQLTETLRDLINCPYNADRTTVPSGDPYHEMIINKRDPNNMVINYSIGYGRVLSVHELLKQVAAFRVQQIVEQAPSGYWMVIGSYANDIKVYRYETEEEYIKDFNSRYGWHSIQEGYLDDVKISHENNAKV